MQLQDMTARRSAEDQLKHRVSRDQLTGLANRSVFTDRLDKALADSDPAGGMPAIIAMAQALGLVTVAEGVENEEQAAILRRAGCLLAQGYFYGEPHTAAELEAILDRGGPLPHRSAQPEHLVDERADHPGHCRGGVLRVGGGQQRVADRQPYE
jgi:predicted signal transduction protein with EAL and GGDEF domain